MVATCGAETGTSGEATPPVASACCCNDVSQIVTYSPNGTNLFLDRGFHRKIIRVKPALSLLLLPRPPASTLATIPFASLDSRVPVTNRLVPLRKERILRNPVLLNVPIDKVEVPREEGVELDEAGRIDLKGLEAGAVCALGCPPAGDHRFDAELLISTTSRFNLKNSDAMSWAIYEM